MIIIIDRLDEPKMLRIQPMVAYGCDKKSAREAIQITFNKITNTLKNID